MGHEMGHIAGRHAQERISQHLAFSVGAATVTYTHLTLPTTERV